MCIRDRDNRPLNFEEFESKINQMLFVSATPSVSEADHELMRVEQIIRPTGLLDPKIDVDVYKRQELSFGTKNISIYLLYIFVITVSQAARTSENGSRAEKATPIIIKMIEATFLTGFRISLIRLR